MIRTIEHWLVYRWTGQHNYHRSLVPYVWAYTLLLILGPLILVLLLL